MVRSRQLGFSLIEIMIVVALIGLLVSIAVPNWLLARTSSREKVCKNNMRQIHFAAEQYLINNNTMTVIYPDDLIGSSSYISAEPVCPSNNGAYTVLVASGVVDVQCGSDEHGRYDGEYHPF